MLRPGAFPPDIVGAQVLRAARDLFGGMRASRYRARKSNALPGPQWWRCVPSMDDSLTLLGTELMIRRRLASLPSEDL